MARGERAGAGSAGAAGVRLGDDPAGLSNQYLGHADLLPAQIGPAREARPQVRGIRRALRQSHHAADSGNLTMQQMVARQVDLMPRSPSSSATTRAASS